MSWSNIDAMLNAMAITTDIRMSVLRSRRSPSWAIAPAIPMSIIAKSPVWSCSAIATINAAIPVIASPVRWS